MSLKQSQLMLLATLPKRKQDFMKANVKGKSLLEYFHADAQGAFPRMAKAIREARKAGYTKIPTYLNLLTEIEKNTLKDAYYVFTDPIKLHDYMDKVSDEELLNVRLMLLKDRIENPDNDSNTLPE